MNSKFLIENAIFFKEALVDTGNNVYSFKSELLSEKIGVTETYLSGAEEYFRNYQNFNYLSQLISQTFTRLNIEPRGIVIDLGSGFGNTVIPLLERYADINVIATDISPQLLGILMREASLRGLENRCIAVAQDAQVCYFKPQIADLVLGCAVLHHMIDPQAALASCLFALKPGGKAIFFEPFEMGSQVLHIAYKQIFSQASSREKRMPAFVFLQGISNDINARTKRESAPEYRDIWRKLDDKWMFTYEHFQSIAKSLNCKVEIFPLHDQVDQFTRHTRQILVDYAGLKADDLPSWAYEIIQSFDRDYFSSEGLKSLPIEACVVVTAC
jgi:ubiquinone/menaquinone biosynthesis C-methylase UbiE